MGGHQTDAPSESTYSSVVSRNNVRTAFTLAALNDLNVWAADVQEFLVPQRTYYLGVCPHYCRPCTDSNPVEPDGDQMAQICEMKDSAVVWLILMSGCTLL